MLSAIDGGTALAKAIRAEFGGKTLVHRCRRHKATNILDHLPAVERLLLQRRLRAAWALADASAAERSDKPQPGAAASLREGLGETVTVNRLGVTGSLLRTVESTTPSSR